jgi:hypothetical protein
LCFYQIHCEFEKIYDALIVQSILDEEGKGGSPKRVFISGQTTHITIEEEHPGGEDMNPESPAEDDDFDIDIQSPHSPHSKLSKRLEFIFALHCANVQVSVLDGPGRA